MTTKPLSPLSQFLGLNNTADPLIGTTGADGKPRTWHWQSKAENVNFTDAGRCTRRDGYAPFVEGSGITASFSTFDFERLYIVAGETLMRVNQDGTTVPLRGGLSGAARWAEINDAVYLSCGNQKLEVRKDDEVMEWGVPTPQGGQVEVVSGELPPGQYQACFTFIDEAGREGGASASIAVTLDAEGGLSVSSIPHIAGHYTLLYIAERSPIFRLAAVLPVVTDAYVHSAGVLGRELVTQFLDPPPANALDIAAFRGQLYAAEYIPEADVTAVWASEPMGFHLFSLNSSFLQVPGQVTQMAGADDVLLIVTRTRTYLYDGEGLRQVAEYGGPPGQHVDMDTQRRLCFWTDRGLCRAPPFENLTESRVSVAPGNAASGGIIQQHGYSRYVVALQIGGSPFNKR